MVGGQRHAPVALPPGKDPVLIAYKTGWAPRPVWTGTENLSPYRASIPERPASSESLYRLSYPAPLSYRKHHVYFSRALTSIPYPQ